MTLTPTMNNFTRDELIDKLNVNECTVVFTKKDGTERTMVCTRSMDMVPEDHKPKSGSSATENLDVVKVYDIESEGWRSFRVDSVFSLVIN